MFVDDEVGNEMEFDGRRESPPSASRYCVGCKGLKLCQNKSPVLSKSAARD
jgi:hypothetical protein